MTIRGLLVHKRGDHSSDASEFHFHKIVPGFAGSASNEEGFLALIRDGELDGAGLGRSDHHGEHDLLRIHGQILQQRDYHAVGNIGGNLNSLTAVFLLAVIVLVTDRELARGDV